MGCSISVAGELPVLSSEFVPILIYELTAVTAVAYTRESP